jgi:hypothetical protein
MSESSNRKADAESADVRSEFTVTEFGRRRVSGGPWSLRRLLRLLAWPFTFLARRKDAGGRFPKSNA